MLFILLKVTLPTYSIETGTITPTIPTSSFTTNYTTATKNYIQSALGSSSSYSTYFNNFDVASSYYDSSKKYPLYSLQKNLEFSKTTETFNSAEDGSYNITSEKLMYIITHGYNLINDTNTVFSSNSLSDSEKQYITQVALWLFLYENQSSYSDICIDTGAGYSACDFIDTSSKVITSANIRTAIEAASKVSGYTYLSLITNLVDEATNYSGNQTSSLQELDYTPSITSKYYITSTITPTANSNSSNLMYYSIELSDPNNYGAYITDENGDKITNLKELTGSFKVYVLLSENIDLSTIKVTVYGYFVVNKGYAYKVNESTIDSNSASNIMNKYNGEKYQKYADVILGTTPYEIVSKSFSLNNYVVISKIDASTGDLLEGATLVLKSKSDSLKNWTWKSTTKPYYIELSEGDYTICETEYPTGYTSSTNESNYCIDFTVSNNKILEVEIENIKVPNTSKNKTSKYIIYGIGIILSGLFLIGLSRIHK